MKQFYKNFVRDLRTKNSISAPDLSIKIEIPLPQLYRIERGDQIPDYHQSKKIAEYFGLEWHYVMEKCVDHQLKQEKHATLYQKFSESINKSNDCTKEGVVCKRC